MTYSMGKKLVMFFVKNAELNQSGQGVIGITCPKLWNMTDEEFINNFGRITRSENLQSEQFNDRTGETQEQYFGRNR